MAVFAVAAALFADEISVACFGASAAVWVPELFGQPLWVPVDFAAGVDSPLAAEACFPAVADPVSYFEDSFDLVVVRLHPAVVWRFVVADY